VYGHRKECEKYGFWKDKCNDFYSAEEQLNEYQFKENCEQESFVQSMSSKLGVDDEDVPYLAHILDTMAEIKKDISGSTTLEQRLITLADSLNSAASIVSEVHNTIGSNTCTNSRQQTFVSTFDSNVNSFVKAVPSSVVSRKNDVVAAINSGSTLEAKLNSAASNFDTNLDSLSNLIRTVQNDKTTDPILDLSLTTACQSEAHPVLKAILPSSSNHKGYETRTKTLVDDSLALYQSKGFDVSQETSAVAATSQLSGEVSVAKALCSIYTSIQ